MLLTPRLILRPWRDSDLAAFAALNADPRVMDYFPAPLSREESDQLVQRIRAGFAEHGYGYWAVEAPGVAAFIGCTGLSLLGFMGPPCVEVGWRLAAAHWGRGYATEAARAAISHGFAAFDLPEILAFTAASNARSIAVMQRLGMRRARDFAHPALPDGHKLQPHVLYRLAREDWHQP